MNANKSSRLNKAHIITPTLTVVPVTRAIRAALAISFTLLALGGSSVAFAQTCVATTATETCEGAFTNTLPDPAFFSPVADLTLVLGDSANSVPTSVIPAAGLMGIDANWGGNVGVTSFADITTVGATGLFAYGSTTATVNNQGSITTNVTAAGAKAMDVNAYGDVSVVNNGPVNAYSTDVYDVTAVNATSINGKVTVDNQALGTITATAQDGNAIAVNAYATVGAITVSNEGSISASSINGYAGGVVARAVNGNVSVTNSGRITAKSTNYQAVGVLASSNYGDVRVTNSGYVTATGGQDQAIGIEASAELGSTVVNTGYVTATSSYGTAIGIVAQTTNGDANVTTSGSITTTTNSLYQAAVGAVASSVNGQSTVDNSGRIQAINHNGLGVGIEAYSALGSTIANSGYVLGGSYTGNATGLLAAATTGDVVVSNSTSGNIRTVSQGSDYFEAIGVSAYSVDGKVSVSNDGRILALAPHGAAVGIHASAGGVVYVENSGHVAASNVYYNSATGILARSSNGAATVINSGSIYAYSLPRLGSAADKTAVNGIVAVSSAGTLGSTGTYGPTAMATVVNSGYIRAQGPWFVNGISAGSYGGTSVTNTPSGSILAIGLNPVGIQVIESPNSYADYGSGVATINNAGSIRVGQVGNCYCNGINSYGYGIQVVSGFGGDIAISNSGSIGVNTQHGGFGIDAYDFIGKATVSNSGSIVISGASVTAFQLFGESVRSAYGGVSATNSGDITVLSAPVAGQLYVGSIAKGIYAKAGRAGSVKNHGGGDAVVVNTGQINIDSHAGYGISTNSQYGMARAYNSGAITLNDDFLSVGITATAGNSIVLGVGSVVLDNVGSVSATASNQATGLRATTSGASFLPAPGIDVAIDNSGYVGASSQQVAQGIVAYSFHEDIFTIDNSGSVVASATINNRTGQYAGASGKALGIHTSNYAAGATVTNSGDIAAVTHEDNQQAGVAAGIFTINGIPVRYGPIPGVGYGDTSITNTGSISASLVSSNALPPVPLPPREYIGQELLFGPSNTATGILAMGTYGDVAITNAGTINASAQSDHYAGGGSDNGVTTANGIAVVSSVGNTNGSSGNAFSAGNIVVTNSANGSIAANAESSDASGDTAMASGIAALVSVGSYGASLVSANHGIAIANEGSVSATALIANDAAGVATATGISAINGSAAGFANVTNYGAISATATGPGAATATGIFANGYSVAVALNKGGSINATATGSTGTATGLSLINTGIAPLTTTNNGELTATFVGAGGKATGATITSGGDVTLSNTGHILASNATSAVGVAFNSPTNVTLTNSGTITANAAAAGSAAVLSTGASNAALTNSGTITGAIQTGAGNDTLSNAAGGIWNAVGTSDFGAGDVTVSNAGTIHLNNTTISLGSDPAGNQFVTTGTITVLGSNTITMGTGTTVNPNPFTNNGTLNFRNGAANNVLTIAGNFAGNGQIDMDVNGANSTGDLLKITGNVAAGSVNTVNVNLLTDPTTASTMIPLVQVAGTATAGSFVMGQFVQPKGFLGLTESLVTTPSPATLALTVAPATVTPPLGTPPATSPGTPPVAPPPSGTGVVVAVNGLSQLGTLAASAAPGVQSLMTSQIGTLEDRMGAVSQTIKGGLSLWTRAFANSGTVDPDHSAGNFGQNGNFGFDQSNTGEELGLDFAIADTIKAGALFAKSQANQSLDGNQADSSKITGNTSGIYGTYIDPSGLYVDVSYRWMSFNDRLHAPNGYASIHGNADAFNLEAGKTWVLQNGLQIAPQFQYTLTKVDNINAQTGGVAGFQSSGDDSSRARLGVMFSKTYTPASSHALWMPYASLSAVQELDGKNSYAVNNTFFGETNTKGTSVLAETGVNVQLGKLAVFGGLNWQDGAQKSFFGGQVGLRYIF